MATTVPAVPPPAMMKSNDVLANVAASSIAADANVALSERETKVGERRISEDDLNSRRMVNIMGELPSYLYSRGAHNEPRT